MPTAIPTLVAVLSIWAVFLLGLIVWLIRMDSARSTGTRMRVAPDYWPLRYQPQPGWLATYLYQQEHAPIIPRGVVSSLSLVVE